MKTNRSAVNRNAKFAVGLLLSLSLPLTLLAAAGCAHKKVTETDSTTYSKTSAPSARASGGATSSHCASDLDCGDKQLCINSQCVNITVDLAECAVQRVHFDKDAVSIHPDDFPKLQRVARCLKADRAMSVEIEGNADERGTDEYNMALGDRRAGAVATYLHDLGVSQPQLKTISYGKEHPLCAEHDEECWSKNRRTAIKPQETK